MLTHCMDFEVFYKEFAGKDSDLDGGFVVVWIYLPLSG